ncbi:hypothetical protein SFR_5229 [Streptomyces sp. FR-008]|nr:hypothetical protein SFR_5229 [Streptomyces sp. FR-008]
MRADGVADQGAAGEVVVGEVGGVALGAGEADLAAAPLGAGPVEELDLLAVALVQDGGGSVGVGALEAAAAVTPVGVVALGPAEVAAAVGVVVGVHVAGDRAGVGVGAACGGLRGGDGDGGAECGHREHGEGGGQFPHERDSSVGGRVGTAVTGCHGDLGGRRPASQLPGPGEGGQPHPAVRGGFLGVRAQGLGAVLGLQCACGLAQGGLPRALGLGHGQRGFGAQGLGPAHALDQAVPFAADLVGTREGPARLLHAPGPGGDRGGQACVLEDARDVQGGQGRDGLPGAEPGRVVAVQAGPRLGVAAGARGRDRASGGQADGDGVVEVPVERVGVTDALARRQRVGVGDVGVADARLLGGEVEGPAVAVPAGPVDVVHDVAARLAFRDARHRARPVPEALAPHTGADQGVLRPVDRGLLGEGQLPGPRTGAGGVLPRSARAAGGQHEEEDDQRQTLLPPHPVPPSRALR